MNINTVAIVMECTGRYYKPVVRELSRAGFFVSAVNPQIMALLFFLLQYIYG